MCYVILNFIDFVYQTGTFESSESSIWEDLFVQIVGSLIGAIAGIMGSLYLFNQQLIHQEADRAKQIEREDQQKLEARTREEHVRSEEHRLEIQIKNDYEKDQLEYVYSLIKGSISYIDHFVKGAYNFIEEIQKNSIEFPLLDTGLANDLTRFVRDVNHQATNTYYRRQIRVNNYLEIVHFLEYFEAVKNEILSILEKARQYDYSRKVEFRDALNKTVVELRNILMKLKAEGQRDTDMYKNLDAILLTHISIVDKNPGNLLEMRTKVVQPLISFFIYHTDKTLKIKYLHLLDIASETNKMLTPVKLNNESTAKDLNYYADEMSKNMTELKEKFMIFNEYFTKTSDQIPENN